MDSPNTLSSSQSTDPGPVSSYCRSTERSEPAGTGANLWAKKLFRTTLRNQMYVDGNEKGVGSTQFFLKQEITSA